MPDASFPSYILRLGERRIDCSARTLVMGVLNVTPDSFSDGGRFNDVPRAVEQALAMIDEGADIVDVGGESTRPRGFAYGTGAEPVSVEEELRRVVPVIERLAGLTDVPLSIDTYKADVADRALQAGAVMVNDISGFHFDPRMPEVVAAGHASAVIMHTKGKPRDMQQNPAYGDLFGEITGYLQEGIRLGEIAGVTDLVIDPGIGFGKSLQDNLRLIAGLDRFRPLGRPILLGPSRKSFIGTILQLPVGERLEGSLAAVVAAILYGANIVRVHDVRQAKRAAVMADAIRRASVDVHTHPG